MEQYFAAKLRSRDFYLENSEKELLKVVERLEKIIKYKIKSKKDYNNRIQQEKINQLRSMELYVQFEGDTDR